MLLGETEIRPLGRTDDVCPSCGVELARRPGRKASCPHCGEYIYVRTRPWDGRRVLASESETVEVEAQWRAFYDFKWGIRQMALEFPQLMPLFDDLHTGRRGQTPVDWLHLEAVVSGIPATTESHYRDLIQTIKEQQSKRTAP